MNSQLDSLDKFDILRFGTKFYFVFNRIFEGLIFASFLVSGSFYLDFMRLSGFLFWDSLFF